MTIQIKILSHLLIGIYASWYEVVKIILNTLEYKKSSHSYNIQNSLSIQVNAAQLFLSYNNV